MTASLPDIGTLSIFPSVPKRKKKSKRKKDTEELFRYFFESTDYDNLSHLNVKTHQIGSHCCEYLSNFSKDAEKGQTVSKYARKLCPCSRVNACSTLVFLIKQTNRKSV